MAKVPMPVPMSRTTESGVTARSSAFRYASMRTSSAIMAQ